MKWPLIAITALGVAAIVAPARAGADVWLRDCTSDAGNEPSSCPNGIWWQSPDIWMAFGARIRSAGLVVQGENVASSWRVQIRNRGDANATNVSVTLWYRSNATGLHFPDSKCHVIGTRTLASALEPDESRIVTIVGNAVPAPPHGSSWHYCIGAAVRCDGDPAYTNDSVIATNNKACTNNPYLFHRFGDAELIAGFTAETKASTAPGFHTMQTETDLPHEWSFETQMRPTPESPWVHYEPGEPFWLDGTEEHDVDFRLLVTKPDEPLQGEMGTISVLQEFIETGEVMGGIDYVVYQDNHAPLPIPDLDRWTLKAPKTWLTWSVPEHDNGGYEELVAFFEVHRSPDAGFQATPETLIAKTAVDANDGRAGWQHLDDDPTLIPGETYYYKVVAVDYAKWRSESNEVEAPPCTADISRDGDIGFPDLLSVLSNWGPCDCPADIDRDGEVGFSDLLLVLSEWGSCV